MAGNSGPTTYIWDITNSNPYLIKTFIAHAEDTLSLAFSSSLISSSSDGSIKFWQINTSSVDPVVTNSESTILASTSIVSASLQKNDGIAISSDSAGVVKTWDISTGLCKASFHIPVKGFCWREVQLVDGRLISVWCEKGGIYIWDIDQEEYLQIVDVPFDHWAVHLRISGDRSKVFALDGEYIRAWSIWTGEVMGEVRLECEPSSCPLIMDGSRVWVHFMDLQTQGWDFGISGSTPLPLPNILPGSPHLDFINATKIQDTGLSRIEDTATGQEIFRLPRRYAKPTAAQWDGQYLVAGYDFGELLILDFKQTIPQ